MSGRVLLVDDHALIAQGLVTALASAGFEATAVVPTDDLSEIVSAVQAHRPDVILLDLHLGGTTSAIPLIAPLRAGGAVVIALTAVTDEVRLAEAVEAGAAGVLVKSEPFDALVEALRDVLDGRPALAATRREQLLAGLRAHRRHQARRRGPFDRLTAQERSVLAALVQGRHVEEIARDLVIAPSTVRTHVKALHRKLGVKSQLAAVALAREVEWEVDGRPGPSA